ncbi:type III pantothenate kinase [Methyloprofundus sp.]|uniref:type III pantothenate kinase n=1 Tax=Methyloprofundus sp. TaxID=2020875 RepID=UPI003D0B31B5
MILIDIGNTRIKWAVQQAGQLEEMHAMVHIGTNIEIQLLAAWQPLNTPGPIYLACVGAESVKLQVIRVAEQLWPHISLQEISTQKYAQGVHNAYPIYSKLGVDRWLAILGAFHEYTAPVCIVSSGSAITLDIVDAQGQHLGGMIMPGLNLLQQALAKGTANLKIASEQYPLGLANDTEAAIYNGNLCAIKGFIQQGIAEFKKPIQLILTGGDANYLADSLKLDAIIDARLVLKGLALIANESI